MRQSTSAAALMTALMAALAAASPAEAADLYDRDGTKLEFSVDGMAGIFSTREDYLGEGGKRWQEAFIHGLFKGSRKLGEGEAYAGLGALARGTWGDGDAGGYTTGRERKVNLDDAFLGWRSANGFVDFSFGRQQFQLGDGFLIAGDRVNLGKGLDVLGVDVDRGGAYYIAARKSFQKTALLRLDPEGPLRGDAYWLQSDNPYHQNTALGGLNVEYVSAEKGTLGLSWFRILDVDPGVGLSIFDHRKGMRVTSLRGQGSAGIENLFLSAEYVDQRGGSTPVKTDANAWYLEGGWTFAGLPWKPSVNLRHARFSADKASTTANEAFDPLFFGLGRGLGTWFQGEVAANYAGPTNSGNKLNRLEMTVTPREDLTITLQYWDIKSIGDGARRDGREIDLFAFWQINEKVTFVPLIGLYEPRGAEVVAAQGNDRRNLYLQAVVLFNF